MVESLQQLRSPPCERFSAILLPSPGDGLGSLIPNKSLFLPREWSSSAVSLCHPSKRNKSTKSLKWHLGDFAWPTQLIMMPLSPLGHLYSKRPYRNVYVFNGVMSPRLELEMFSSPILAFSMNCISYFQSRKQTNRTCQSRPGEC